MEDMLSIGEVAARSGVAVSALRYYEAEGLINAERTAGGHRQFPRWVLRRVAIIVFAQRMGLTLAEVRSELDRLPTGRPPDAGDWARLTARWQAHLDARMRELEHLRRGLSECIGCGCLSLEKCALANPADRAGRQGPGPRFWLGDDPASGAAEPAGG